MEVDSDGEPIERALWHSRQRVVSAPERAATGFLDDLPLEIARSIWNRIMSDGTVYTSFLHCSLIRAVCKSWQRHVDAQPEWTQGMRAWFRYCFNEESESDEEWVDAEARRRFHR